MNSVAVAVILLLLGVTVRAIVGPIRQSRIPASVVAGLLGCAIVQLLRSVASADWFAAHAAPALDDFRSWNDVLISLVFAGLLLAPEGESGAKSRDVWMQGVAAWIIIVGQVGLGLIAFAVLVQPFYEMPGPMGQFIEVTMAGGFGSASAMASLLESPAYRFPDARELLVFGATVGLVWGVISGIALARFGQSRGWTQSHDEPAPISAADAGASNRADIGVDTILFQFCFLVIGLGVGIWMQSRVGDLGAWLDRTAHLAEPRFARNLGNLPLFSFALIGGWLVRLALRAIGLSRLLDREMIHRLCGVAMDLLIVTSLARISFAAVGTYLWPVMLMLVIGSAWSAFCLVWLSPRVLPRRYWFELGLINYGFSTAATAQGMMFLRMVDPKLKSGAAETYALGAPLTAPFIGGGVITFLVLPWLIDSMGSLVVGLISMAIVGALFVAGRRLHGR